MCSIKFGYVHKHEHDTLDHAIEVSATSWTKYHDSTKRKQKREEC